MMGVSIIYKNIVARELQQYASLSWWKRLWFRRKTKPDIFLEAIARMKDADIARVAKDALSIALPQVDARFAVDVTATAPDTSVPAASPVQSGRRSSSSSRVQVAGANVPRLQRTGHVSLSSLPTTNPLVQNSSSRHSQPPPPVGTGGDATIEALKEVVVDNGTSPMRVMKLPVVQQPEISDSDSDGPPPLPTHDGAPTHSSAKSFNSAQAGTVASAGTRRLQGMVARVVSSSQSSRVAVAQESSLKMQPPSIESARNGKAASAVKRQFQNMAARVVSESRGSGAAVHADGIELQPRASAAATTHFPPKNKPSTAVDIEDDALVYARTNVLRPNSILLLAADRTQISEGDLHVHGSNRKSRSSLSASLPVAPPLSHNGPRPPETNFRRPLAVPASRPELQPAGSVRNSPGNALDRIEDTNARATTRVFVRAAKLAAVHASQVRPSAASGSEDDQFGEC